MFPGVPHRAAQCGRGHLRGRGEVRRDADTLHCPGRGHVSVPRATCADPACPGADEAVLPGGGGGVRGLLAGVHGVLLAAADRDARPRHARQAVTGDQPGRDNSHVIMSTQCSYPYIYISSVHITYLV